MTKMENKLDKLSDQFSDVRVDIGVIKEKQNQICEEQNNYSIFADDIKKSLADHVHIDSMVQDKMLSKLDNVDKTLETNTLSLVEHMKRWEASENRIGLIEDSTTEVNTKIEKHLSFLKGATWLTGIVGSIVGLLYKFGIL